MNRLFKGTGVALVTPFKGGKVDFPALEKVINHCIEGKLEYLVSMGTTGESVTLNSTEKVEVLNATSEIVNGRVPLLAGFGGNNTEEVIQSIRSFDFNGYQGILSVSPAYNKPTQEGIYQHFKAIEAAAPLPIMLYNVPSRTSRNMTAETTLRLAHSSTKFFGVKEASGDLNQVMKIVKHRPDDFLVVSGDDLLTLPMMSFGTDGVISVVANAFPLHFSNLVREGLSGNFGRAAKLHLDLLEIVDLLFVEGNPAGVKAALNILGVCGQDLRLPLVPVSEPTYKNLETAIKRLPDI